MLCNGLIIDRGSSNDFGVQQNVVNTDPLLYSYQQCGCVAPLVAYYHIDSAGRPAHVWGAQHASKNCKLTSVEPSHMVAAPQLILVACVWPEATEWYLEQHVVWTAY